MRSLITKKISHSPPIFSNLKNVGFSGRQINAFKYAKLMSYITHKKTSYQILFNLSVTSLWCRPPGSWIRHRRPYSVIFLFLSSLSLLNSPPRSDRWGGRHDSPLQHNGPKKKRCRRPQKVATEIHIFVALSTNRPIQNVGFGICWLV